jgi:hypothetical protein
MLTTFYFLIIAHLIGDFILQGPLAVKKRGFNKYMLAHGGIMAVSFFIPLISYPAGKVIIGTLIVLISHLIIDAFIVEVKRLLKVDPPKYLFYVFLGIDQILHISILYFVFSRIIS